MNYPDYTTYRILYARYFKEERLAKLLAGLSFRGGVILDLCCGEGRVALEAIRRGALVVIAVDECNAMISPDVFNTPNIIVTPNNSVERTLSDRLRVISPQVKLAICQQAVNYWLTRKTAEQLHSILEDGGIFAFNTFNTCPSDIPSTESYKLKGRQYMECSYMIGAMVHHVQVCEGIAPHVTTFAWLSESMIRSYFCKLFDVDVCHEGRSSIYRCTKI